MPIIDRSQAKESGFAQVREAMTSFTGDVISAEFGMWGGTLVDENGKPIPPKEFLEINCVNVEVLEVTEELAMAIDEWNFRVNCSDFKGSFWIEDFLASADVAKLLVPDGLVGKRITWRKVTRKGTVPMYDATNFIIGEVIGATSLTAPAPRVVAATSTAKPATPVAATVEAATEEPIPEDPMAVVLDLAVGKTETQFRSAIGLHPQFVNSPLLPLAKAGAITSSLVEQGKLVLVGEGAKAVYQRPE